jgi:uncharacterized protein YijF (DUF1287 family)
MEPARHVTNRTIVPATRLSAFQANVVRDLDRQCKSHIWYQDGYFSGGDPPPGIGVCTDVVVRSFRAGGVDLQSLVQRDIAAASGQYAVRRPDPNIDHRRCRNLVVFFRRHATTLPAYGPHADWEPGDIVFWDTAGSGQADHVGVIGDHLDTEGHPTVVHHWPNHYVEETDWLYRLPIVKHFRYKPASGTKPLS